MGTIKRGILGGFSKKVANIVGGSWKGIAYMRSLPLSVANPKTNLQVAQRTAFAGVVAVAVYYLTSIVKPLWDRFAVRESGYNAFVRANIKCWIGSDFVNCNDFVISMGKMEKTPILSGTGENGGQGIEIFWNNMTLAPNQRPDDVMYAVAYCFDNQTWNTSQQGAIRNDSHAKIFFDDRYPDGSTFFCYLAARRADGSMVSNTSLFSIISS